MPLPRPADQITPKLVAAQLPSSLPALRCGSCLEVIPSATLGRSTRCAHCGRALSVPSHVRLKCSRCNHSQHIRSRELGTERLCAKCGQTLLVEDVILHPRQRRHHAIHHTHANNHYISAHADAAAAVLIVGLTLVITVLALTIL